MQKLSLFYLTLSAIIIVNQSFIKGAEPEQPIRVSHLVAPLHNFGYDVLKKPAVTPEMLSFNVVDPVKTLRVLAALHREEDKKSRVIICQTQTDITPLELEQWYNQNVHNRSHTEKPIILDELKKRVTTNTVVSVPIEFLSGKKPGDIVMYTCQSKSTGLKIECSPDKYITLLGSSQENDPDFLPHSEIKYAPKIKFIATPEFCKTLNKMIGKPIMHEE